METPARIIWDTHRIPQKLSIYHTFSGFRFPNDTKSVKQQTHDGRFHHRSRPAPTRRVVGWRRYHTGALWWLIKWLAMDGMMIACDQIVSWKTQTWQTRERENGPQFNKAQNCGVCRYWSTSPPYFLGSPEVPRDTKFLPTITWVWLNMEHDMECNQNFNFKKKTRWSTLNLGLTSISDQAISLLLVAYMSHQIILNPRFS